MRQSVLSYIKLFKLANVSYSKLRIYCVNNLNNNLFNNLARVQFYNITHKTDAKSKVNNSGAVISKWEFNFTGQNTDFYYINTTIIFITESLEESREKLITQLNFANVEDAKPFYKLPTKTLVHIYQTTKNDNQNGHCSNRLYYIAERLEVGVCLKRWLVFQMFPLTSWVPPVLLQLL